MYKTLCDNTYLKVFFEGIYAKTVLFVIFAEWVCRNVSGKAELLVQIERCLVNYMSPYDYDKADFVLQLLLKVSNHNETEFVKVRQKCHKS